MEGEEGDGDVFEPVRRVFVWVWAYGFGLGEDGGAEEEEGLEGEGENYCQPAQWPEQARGGDEAEVAEEESADGD